MQEAINLYNSKNYKKAYEEFCEIKSKDSQNIEVLNYIFKCSKYLKLKNTIEHFNELITSLFNQQQFNNLKDLIHNHSEELNLKNKINFILTLFETGEVNKSYNLYLSYLERFLEQKNYFGVSELLKIESQILKYHPKAELIKLIYWSDLHFFEEINNFLLNLEAAYTKNWKSFRDLKIEKIDFIKKIINVLNDVASVDAEIYKKISTLELKFNLRKFDQQELLEYLILNIEDIPRQSFIVDHLDEAYRDQYRELIQSLNLSTEEKKSLAKGFFEFEKSKIVVTPNKFEDEISEVLKFDQLPSPVENIEKEQVKESYVITKSEEEIIKKIKNNEIEDKEEFTTILIENSFLKAAEVLCLEIHDEELKNYLLGEIYLRLEDWTSLIDHCFKAYDNASFDLKINLNYFLGSAYLEQGDKQLANKYFSKVIAEDPNFRSVREKVSVAKN